MKYTIFFTLLAIYLSTVLSRTSGILFILVGWTMVNLLIFALAYGSNRPGFILGKDQFGKINVILAVINLPWLAITWITFLIQALISKENKLDNISGTNWYISRYPGLSYPLGFEYIIDLTAEFPKAKHSIAKYVCYANLDGVPLKNIIENIGFSKTSKILVHCAQGHGRSATWTSINMNKAGLYKNSLEAYEAILSSRPGAKASKSQYQQIEGYS